MESTVTGLLKDAGTRLITESIFGALLIVVLAIAAIIITILWKAWRQERLDRATDRENLGAEIKGLNVQLNQQIAESIRRETEANKRSDAIVEVMERSMEMTERALNRLEREVK